MRRSVTWAFRGDGRIAFLYLQVPDKYLRIEYAYGAAMRMIGESWLENREGSETVQFDMSYMFKDDNYLSGQTLSVYDKDQPFYQGNSWDTIRQNYDEMPFANESIIKGRDIQE